MPVKMLRTVIAALFSLPVLPPAARAQNLLDIYSLASANDAQFAAAHGAYEAGVEKYAQGRSQLLPSLNASAERTKYDSELHYGENTSFESGEREFKERKWAVTLTQPVYRKENIEAYRQGKAQKDAAEAELEAARQDLILRVARAYLDLLSAQQDAETAAVHASTTMTQAETARSRFQAGGANRIDVAEARSRASVALADRISTKDAVIDKRNALQRLINQAPGTLDELRSGFALPPLPGNASVWVETAHRHNAQLRALDDNVKVARHEIQRARGGHYPKLDAVAQSSSNYATGSIYTAASSDTRYTSVGLRLELGLYQGGLIASRTREAQGLLTKAESEMEDARRELAVRTTQALSAARSGLAKVRALEEALRSAQESASAGRRGLEIGVRNLLEVLDAEQRTYDIARDLIRARQEYVLSWLQLKASAGLLREADLAEINSQLAAPSAPAATDQGDAATN